jgi:hypothetical protein
VCTAVCPAGYIFESQMVTALLGLFPQAPYRNVALQCLTEVSRLWQLLAHTQQPGSRGGYKLGYVLEQRGGRTKGIHTVTVYTPACGGHRAAVCVVGVFWWTCVLCCAVDKPAFNSLSVCCPCRLAP